jgi:V-type H+-transporting ATPase subunit a
MVVLCCNSALTQKILALKACRGWELPGRGELGGDDDESELKERKVDVESDGRIRSDVVGLITPAMFPNFNRMLYRVTRGNAFVRSSDISFEYEGETRSYTVFMVVVAGKDLAQRIRRMMKSFNAEVIDTPTSKEAYPGVISQLETELRDQRVAMDTTRRRILQLLRTIAGDASGSQLRYINSHYLFCLWFASQFLIVLMANSEWQSLAIEEKSIADAMTKCQFYVSMTAIEGWVPTAYLPDLRYHVRRATEGTGHPPAVVDCEPHNTIKQPKPDKKPTYFETDKYTAVFQGIVDTYGIARYQEVNPGLFTIVTFPFLFGVMYGDIGHGTLLTIASFLMIWFEGKLKEKVKRGEFLGNIPYYHHIISFH